jgi:23S rRNA (cytidine1920-2'-O)/16S rRNA (cytidine1409-2'-O)-methyltransferase
MCWSAIDNGFLRGGRYTRPPDVVKMKKQRVDVALVHRGLAPSREVAQRLILAGKVQAGETKITKPGFPVAETDEIHVLEDLKYVSRGGFKLERALDAFEVDVNNLVVLDIGASTGGFTDVLLQRGVKKVYAVDVGYGQIAWKLRQDARVTVMDRVNARYLTKEMFAETIDLAVMDVSFISAHKILEPLQTITDAVVLLLKPQFEAGPENVPRGGVIRDPRIHSQVLENFYRLRNGWNVHGLIESPISGGPPRRRNREFLVNLKRLEPGWNLETYVANVKELLT